MDHPTGCHRSRGNVSRAVDIDGSLPFQPAPADMDLGLTVNDSLNFPAGLSDRGGLADIAAR